MDPSDLSQEAQQRALDAYNTANTEYNGAIQHLNDLNANPSAVPASDITAATAAVDNARTAQAAAARDYANLLGRLAVAYQATQRAAKDPNEQNLWANEAGRAQAQQQLYSAEADMYSAKTQADIDKANATASVALQRADTYAQNSQSLNALRDAQTATANARLAFIPALSQSTIQLHQANIQLAQARATQLIPSQAALNQARADFISGPQAQAMVGLGLLRQAEADQITAMGGVKIDDLKAKINLDDARVAQIQANLQRWNVLPSADRASPTLVEQQPITGDLRSVPNPGYVNQGAQAIKDAYGAIDQIQNMLASGQIQPQDADQLMANIRTSLDAQTRGFTPEQLQQNQQNQANFGRNILDTMTSGGQSQASTLLNAARGARTMPSIPLTPYQNAIGMGGGAPMIQQALSLINQVQPITDRASAFDAASKYGQASQIFKDAINKLQYGGDQGGAQTSTSLPTPGQDQGNPSDQANQLLTSAMAAGLGPGAMGGTNG